MGLMKRFCISNFKRCNTCFCLGIQNKKLYLHKDLMINLLNPFSFLVFMKTRATT